MQTYASLLRAIATTIAVVVCYATSHAAPPDGPFGPIAQTYEVPQSAQRVIHVAPNGAADASGESPKAPTTIEAAFRAATTGDAIILRGGVYRTGDLVTNQGVTVQPFQSERPVLKGTRLATEWQPVRGGLWRTKWDTLFPLPPQPWWQRDREITRTPLHKFNNDMVFVDGELLASCGSAGEVDRASFWIDYDEGYVYVGVNPERHVIEITAHDVAILRTIDRVRGRASDGEGLTVRGVTFAQYAYRAIEIEGRDPEGPSPAAAHGVDVVGSTFEDCSFTYCSRVGGYFRGNGLVIRRCLVSETGTEGIFVLGSSNAILERNVVRRTNNEGITGYYVTAVKIFNQCHNVTCRENLIIDNPAEASGVWYDVGNVDGVFVDNRVERTDNGFFFEISQGARCEGNLFVDCNTGVKILNSRDVTIRGNTFVNSRLQIQRTERSAQNDHFGWHPQTGPDVDEREGHVIVGNLLFADERFPEPLIRFDQAPQLRGELTEPQVAEIDGNVFVRRSNAAERPLIVWAPASTGEGWERFDTLEAFGAAWPDLGSTNEAHLGYRGHVFKSEEAGLFTPHPSFPAPNASRP
ncbi:MAG: hypothetical protein CMJ31_14680 [Phycisphaerae bacterium]|nr:hypothetical protein [Phycisphaerae bacterium]